MSFTLDEILELILTENPELTPSLEPIRDKIKGTLDALSLQQGDEYLSLGIGKNILPLIVALNSVNVTAVDIDKKSLQYQRELFSRFAIYLHNVGGKFELYNFNFDDPNSTKPLNDFVTPPVNYFYGKFDIVEFVNSEHREGELDLVQIMFNYGKNNSRYFVSSYNGPIGKEDKIVKTIIDQANPFRGLGSSIIETNLYTSDKYRQTDGVVVSVYKLCV